MLTDTAMINECWDVPTYKRDLTFVNRKSLSFHRFPTTMASLCQLTPEVEPATTQVAWICISRPSPVISTWHVSRQLASSFGPDLKHTLIDLSKAMGVAISFATTRFQTTKGWVCVLQKCWATMIREKDGGQNNILCILRIQMAQQGLSWNYQFACKLELLVGLREFCLLSRTLSSLLRPHSFPWSKTHLQNL